MFAENVSETDLRKISELQERFNKDLKKIWMTLTRMESFAGME